MQAAIAREFAAPLSIEEIELVAPVPGAVQVDIAACAICQSDVHSIDGAWGGTLPAVYGHEAAGVVSEVGAGVAGLAPGDHVVVTLIRHCGHCAACGRSQPSFCTTRIPLDEESPLRTNDGQSIVQGLRTGAFAERVVVDASQVVRIPESLPLDHAALLACGVITGFGAVANTLRVRPGESVAVFGVGGVGMNSVQAASIGGAGTVIAVDTSDAKLEAAMQFGATHTVNPAKEDLATRVRAAAGNHGVDHAVVSVVTSPVMNAAIAITRAGGTLAVVGMAPDGVTVTLDPTDISNRGIRILGSKMGDTRPMVDIHDLVRLYEQGRLRLGELITGRFPLSDINAALDECRAGQAIRHVVMMRELS